MRLFRSRRTRAKRKLARRRRANNRARSDARQEEAFRGLATSALVPALMVSVVWFSACATILYRRSYSTHRYFVGYEVDRNIWSEVDFSYEDPGETREKREKAAQNVVPVYRIDRFAYDKSLQRLDELREVVRGVRSRDSADGTEESGTDDREGDSVARKLVAGLPEDHVTTLESLGDTRWKKLEELAAGALKGGVAKPEDMATKFDGAAVGDRIQLVEEGDWREGTFCELAELLTPESAAKTVAAGLVHGFSENARSVVAALEAVLPEILLPNLAYDMKATQTARKEKADGVVPELHYERAGVILLRRGARVTESDQARLAEHQKQLQELRRQHGDAEDTAVYSLLCLALVLAAAYSLHVIRPESSRRNREVVLIGVALVLQLLLTRATGDLLAIYSIPTAYLHPLLPLSFGAILLSQLVGLRVALWSCLFTSAVAALQNAMSLEVLLVGVMSSFVGAVSMRRARSRYHILRTSMVVGGTVFLMTAVFFVYRIPLGQLAKILGLAFLNGVIVAVVVSMALPLFEFIFGITTDISLIELSDLNHPLLKRLQLEAPGTYHHSLMVALLAEQAAEAIGVNPLLARVCAYFHDIGKLGQPPYFIENSAGDNPHDELTPRMSSIVILNHVKEGIELALTYKLKRVIREAISQHHGTSLIYFFFRRAKEQSEGSSASGAEAVVEHDFRYPGPKPLSKEAALISIADCCEAAVRSLEKPTPQKIRALVDSVVEQRVHDGQLDDADLTFRELSVAKQTIAKALGTMLHVRVKYPKERQDESEAVKTGGKAAHQGPEGPAAGDGSGGPDDGAGRGSRSRGNGRSSRRARDSDGPEAD